MRKLAVAFLALALLLFGTSLPLVVPRHCPVNRAACERIKEGMTQAEVYAILGGPPGDYRTRPPRPPGFRFWVYTGPPRLIEDWEGDEGAVTVQYQSVTEEARAGPGFRETVGIVTFEEAAPYSPSLLELARWRLARLREPWPR